MTILRNRASLSQVLEKEMEGESNRLRKHVSIAIVKEIVKAKERGWDASRISKEYKVDPSVVQKLEKQIAIPVDNTDGIVRPVEKLTNNRVYGHRSERII